MELSSFGKKMTQKTGILELMDDLGKSMDEGVKMLMLGGGNPAHIPEIDKIWRKRWSEMALNGNELEFTLGNYTTPQGDKEFILEIANFFTRNYGWGISKENVVVLNGSQTAFFYLFNLFAGNFEGKNKKKILLPIVPEYVGYADQGLSKDYFIAAKPKVNLLDNHIFKYDIDFDKLKVTKNIAALCLSRPTNPTGNVVTDSDFDELRILAKNHKIPLIVDNAYGVPFPNIVFTDITPIWDENIIYVMSLSKIGLPGMRTAVVVAREEIISFLIKINAVISLSAGTIGQHLIKPLFKENKILDLCNKFVKPYYFRKMHYSVDFFNKIMEGTRIPYYLHKAEGSMFMWLWCKGLPITSYELYKRLKLKGVLVVPGQYFFPGLKEEWKHKYECLRITYSQEKGVIESGLRIIAEELKQLYV